MVKLISAYLSYLSLSLASRFAYQPFQFISFLILKEKLLF